MSPKYKRNLKCKETKKLFHTFAKIFVGSEKLRLATGQQFRETGIFRETLTNE